MMITDQKTLLFTKIVLWLTLLALLVLVSTPLSAEPSADMRTSLSISFDEKSHPDKVTRDTLLSMADSDIMPALNKQGYRLESAIKTSLIIDNTTYQENDFRVYDASTTLINDDNEDGFFHRFNVSIDVDTLYDSAYIYAKLYLSYEGGPWNLYAISDDYFIYGESADDSFVIETELAEGFPSGYYDVRIEVYDADHDVWLTTYGPYDDAALSALPLQDAFLDEVFIGSNIVEAEIFVVEQGHAGSMSWLLLLIPALITTLRLRDV